jgi:flagellar protein FliO/FliZ
MMESAVSVGIFLVLLACVPLALKWYKQKVPGPGGEVGGQARFISALAVGPHQRVVTIEVGPQGRRVWLTLGVTAQTISCLHQLDVDPGSSGAQEADAG